MEKKGPSAAFFYTPALEFPVEDVDDLLNRLPLAMREHSHRVAVCASIMAESADAHLQLDETPERTSFAAIAHLGGICHDVGKLLLEKTNYRWHPVAGSELLERHKRELFENETMAQMVIETVRYHHEQPNGYGFPQGTTAKDIPFSAAICALADWLDHRLYASCDCKDETDLVHEIEEDAGNLFFTSVVDCFKYTQPFIMETYAKWNMLRQ